MRRIGIATGPVLILAAAVLWGTTGTAQDFAPDGAGSASVGAVRLAVGAAALVLLAARRRRLPRNVARLPLLSAAAAMAVYQPFFFSGVARTGIAVGTIVAIGSAPVLAGGLAFVIRGERIERRWVAATALAVAGATLLVSGGDSIGVDAVGLLLSLGAGAAYAVYTVAAKQLLEVHEPVGIMAAVFAIAAVLLSPYLVLDDVGWVGSIRGSAVALHLGVVATAAAYVLFARGLRQTTVATTATLTLAEPLTAALLGILVVGEHLSAGATLGAGLLLAGLVLVTLSPGRQPEPVAVSRESRDS